MRSLQEVKGFILLAVPLLIASCGGESASKSGQPRQFTRALPRTYPHSVPRARACLDRQGLNTSLKGLWLSGEPGSLHFPSGNSKRTFYLFSPPVLEVGPVTTGSQYAPEGETTGYLDLVFFRGVARARSWQKELVRRPYFMATPPLPGNTVRRIANVVYLRFKGKSPLFARIDRCIRSS